MKFFDAPRYLHAKAAAAPPDCSPTLMLSLPIPRPFLLLRGSLSTQVVFFLVQPIDAFDSGTRILSPQSLRYHVPDQSLESPCLVFPARKDFSLLLVAIRRFTFLMREVTP